MKVLTSKDYQQQMKISIDNATERLHAVLDRIERHRIPTVPSALSSYSLSFQCAKKSEYTIGKLGIGPFALNNAHHVLTQLMRVKMADTPFNKAFRLDSLDKQYDDDGEGSRILDWLSALINAFVDIAKDPFIIRLNVNAYTYNITAYLIRMGYGESVFDLLNQPIIIDIAKRIIASRSNFGKDRTKSQFQVEQEIIRSVAASYGVDLDEVGDIANMLLNAVEDADAQPGQYSLSNAVKYKNESFKAFSDITDGKSSKLSSSDISTRALVLFTIFNNKAKSISDLVKYSKIDTKKHGKTIAEQRQYYRNMLGLINDPEFNSSSIEDFLSKTFIYTKTYNTVNAAYIFGSQLLRANDGFNDRLDNLLKRMGKFDKADSRTISTIVNSMESAIKGNFMNEILFSTGRYEYLDELFFGDNSVPRRLLKLKTDIKRGMYPDLINSEGTITNEFLNYLFPNLLKLNPNVEEPDTIDTRIATNLDINMQNEIIYSWEELLHHPNDEIRELAEDLIYYAFYTSGDQTNPNSFFKFVPASWREESGYGQYLNHILSEESDTQLSMVNDSDIFLNNWQDDNLVPEVKAYARVENVTPFGVQYETVGRFGLTTKKAFDNTTVHPYLFFIGDVGSRNGLNIRPINRIVTDDFVGAIYPPYVKMNFTSRRDISGWVVYKWIGSVVKEGKMGGYIIQPVYSMVSKKGYNQKGHRIVEYGTSLHLDFNDFIDGLDQPVSEKDINTTAMLQTISKSGLSNELQKILLNDLRNFVPASENYKYYQIQDTDSSSLFEEYYESREIEDEATKEPQQVERPTPVQKQTQPRKKMSVEEFSEEWSKAEGVSVEDFNKHILPSIDKAWNMRFMRITNKVEPFARIKLKSIESINTDNRTSVTIFEDNNQFVDASSLKVGNIVEFYDGDGNSVLCVVTRPMRKLTDYVQITTQEDRPQSTSSETKSNGKLDGFIMHSGGAVGADSVWSDIASEYGIPNTQDRQKHYYNEEKTPRGNVQISSEDYQEGSVKVAEAAKSNWGYQYNTMKDNRLIRNWAQVKYSDAVFAIGHLAKPGEQLFPNKKGDTRVAEQVAVQGGTGYAVEMAIQAGKPVYVYDQQRKQWYKNVGGRWSESDTPVLTKNFAGIGTRQINQDGINVIRSVFEKTLQSQNPQTTINIYAGTGENADLSNLAIRPFTHLGVQFQSVEQAFQFYKTEFSPKNEYNRAVGQAIMMSTSGKDLRRLGRQFKGLNQEIWDKMAPTIMRQLILDSFTQNPEAAKRLLDTGNAILTHTQDKGRWGTEFPRLLMDVRDELRNRSSSQSTSSSTQINLQSIFTRLANELTELGYSIEEITSLQYKFYEEYKDKLNDKDNVENSIRKFICNL